MRSRTFFYAENSLFMSGLLFSFRLCLVFCWLTAKLTAQSTPNLSPVRSAKNRSKKIDRIADQTNALAEEYVVALAETNNLQNYKRQMHRLISSQPLELASLGQEIKSIEDTQKQVLPLMQKMTSTLEKFIQVVREHESSRIVS